MTDRKQIRLSITPLAHNALAQMTTVRKRGDLVSLLGVREFKRLGLQIDENFDENESGLTDFERIERKLDRVIEAYIEPDIYEENAT